MILISHAERRINKNKEMCDESAVRNSGSKFKLF
jgi:hypothetical protein